MSLYNPRLILDMSYSQTMIAVVFKATPAPDLSEPNLSSKSPDHFIDILRLPAQLPTHDCSPTHHFALTSIYIHGNIYGVIEPVYLFYILCIHVLA